MKWSHSEFSRQVGYQFKKTEHNEFQAVFLSNDLLGLAFARHIAADFRFTFTYKDKAYPTFERMLGRRKRQGDVRSLVRYLLFNNLSIYRFSGSISTCLLDALQDPAAFGVSAIWILQGELDLVVGVADDGTEYRLPPQSVSLFHANLVDSTLLKAAESPVLVVLARNLWQDDAMGFAEACSSHTAWEALMPGAAKAPQRRASVAVAEKEEEEEEQEKQADKEVQASPAVAEEEEEEEEEQEKQADKEVQASTQNRRMRKKMKVEMLPALQAQEQVEKVGDNEVVQESQQQEFTPSSMPLQSECEIVHRVWICVEGQRCDAMEADCIDMLNACALQGMRQIVWTNDPVTIASLVGPIGRLTVYSWDLLGCAQPWNALLSRGLPVQLVKDMVSVCCLYHCGGTYADMKVMFLPHNSVHHGVHQVCLGSEPVKHYCRTPLRTLRDVPHINGRTCLAQLWLGFFSGPPRHPAFKQALDSMQSFWDKLTVDFTTVAWGNHFLWMENTRQWHGIWARYRYTLLSPQLVCPWPAWLQKAGALGTDLFRYYTPTLQEVADTSAVVCLWRRQWCDTLRSDIRSKLLACLQEVPRHCLWQRLHDTRISATAEVQCTVAPMLQTFFAPERCP